MMHDPPRWVVEEHKGASTSASASYTGRGVHVVNNNNNNNKNKKKNRYSRLRSLSWPCYLDDNCSRFKSMVTGTRGGGPFSPSSASVSSPITGFNLHSLLSSDSSCDGNFGESHSGISSKTSNTSNISIIGSIDSNSNSNSNCKTAEGNIASVRSGLRILQRSLSVRNLQVNSKSIYTCPITLINPESSRRVGYSITQNKRPDAIFNSITSEYFSFENEDDSNGTMERGTMRIVNICIVAKLAGSFQETFRIRSWFEEGTVVSEVDSSQSGPLSALSSSSSSSSSSNTFSGDNNGLNNSSSIVISSNSSLNPDENYSSTTCSTGTISSSDSSSSNNNSSINSGSINISSSTSSSSSSGSSISNSNSFTISSVVEETVTVKVVAVHKARFKVYKYPNSRLNNIDRSISRSSNSSLISESDSANSNTTTSSNTSSSISYSSNDSTIRCLALKLLIRNDTSSYLKVVVDCSSLELACDIMKSQLNTEIDKRNSSYSSSSSSASTSSSSSPSSFSSASSSASSSSSSSLLEVSYLITTQLFPTAASNATSNNGNNNDSNSNGNNNSSSNTTSTNCVSTNNINADLSSSSLNPPVVLDKDDISNLEDLKEFYEQKLKIATNKAKSAKIVKYSTLLREIDFKLRTSPISLEEVNSTSKVTSSSSSSSSSSSLSSSPHSSLFRSDYSIERSRLHRIIHLQRDQCCEVTLYLSISATSATTSATATTTANSSSSCISCLDLLDVVRSEILRSSHVIEAIEDQFIKDNCYINVYELYNEDSMYRERIGLTTS